MKKYIISLGIIAVILGTWGLFSAQKVFGNPSTTVPNNNCKTASATTSLIYLSPGTATTTATCDAFYTDTGSAGRRGTLIDRATVLVQYAATSTETKFQAYIQHSNDGIDWYRSNVTNSASTTGTNIDISTANYFSWTYASSTQNLSAIGTFASSSTLSFDIPTPTRHTRVVFVIPVGAKNGAIWAEIVPKKEVSE